MSLPKNYNPENDDFEDFRVPGQEDAFNDIVNRLQGMDVLSESNPNDKGVYIVDRSLKKVTMKQVVADKSCQKKVAAFGYEDERLVNIDEEQLEARQSGYLRTTINHFLSEHVRRSDNPYEEGIIDRCSFTVKRDFIEKVNGENHGFFLEGTISATRFIPLLGNVHLLSSNFRQSKLPISLNMDVEEEYEFQQHLKTIPEGIVLEDSVSEELETEYIIECGFDYRETSFYKRKKEKFVLIKQMIEAYHQIPSRQLLDRILNLMQSENLWRSGFYLRKSDDDNRRTLLCDGEWDCEEKAEKLRAYYSMYGPEREKRPVPIEEIQRTFHHDIVTTSAITNRVVEKLR